MNVRVERGWICSKYFLLFVLACLSLKYFCSNGTISCRPLSCATGFRENYDILYIRINKTFNSYFYYISIIAIELCFLSSNNDSNYDNDHKTYQRTKGNKVTLDKVQVTECIDYVPQSNEIFLIYRKKKLICTLCINFPIFFPVFPLIYISFKYKKDLNTILTGGRMFNIFRSSENLFPFRNIP